MFVTLVVKEYSLCCLAETNWGARVLHVMVRNKCLADSNCSLKKAWIIALLNDMGNVAFSIRK